MSGQLPKMPASFKAVLPFIRRAEELDRDSSRPESKLIAYFCRQYAMELGIKVRENDTSNEATEYLLALMDRLEEDKNQLPAFTQEEGKEICEDFALEIFTKADDEDRAGRADKNTARTFYAAGTFFDILNQFGAISEPIAEKRKYCKYKAAMILKAIKEGRTPTPGPPDGGIDGSDDLAASGMSFMSTTSSASSMLPPAPTTSPSDAPPAYAPPAPPAYAMPPPAPVAPPTPEPAAFPSFTQSGGSIGPGSSSSSSSFALSSGPPPAAPAAAPPAPAYNNHASAPPAYTPPPQQQQAYTPPPPPQQQQQQQQPIPIRARTGGAASQDQINDAIECAKFAIAALKVKDVELAIQRLDAALRSIR